jgi:hypothetical protein
MNIGEHTVGSKFPTPSGTGPSVVCDPEEFQSLMRRPDGPKALADYLYTDAPQLALHIVSFCDATLVTISWSHTLLDTMGMKLLLQAWSLVLQGRSDEVLPCKKSPYNSQIFSHFVKYLITSIC